MLQLGWEIIIWNGCIGFIRNLGAGDECHRVVAASTSQSELCSGVADVSQRNLCYENVALVTNSSAACQEIRFDAEKKDLCLFRVALRARDTDSCALVVDDSKRDICLMNRAVQELDSTICDLIGSEKIENSCSAAVNVENQRAGAE